MSNPASRLRSARIAAGFPTASDAAHRYGWPVQTYLSHENGSRGYKAERAAEYGQRFKVKPEYLLFGEPKQSQIGALQAAIQGSIGSLQSWIFWGLRRRSMS